MPGSCRGDPATVRRGRFLALLATGLAVAATVGVWLFRCPSGPARNSPPLSSLLPGCCVEAETYGPAIMHAWERLTVRAWFRRRLVQRQEDLIGTVHVRTPIQALELVRLRTLPATTGAWRDGLGYVFEVACGAPMYHLSGVGGVLSSAAYEQGRFAPPTVTPERGGFVVRRWLLMERPAPAGSVPHESERAPNGGCWFVVLVEEHVSHDGAVRRVVLRSRRAPVLPGTFWGIPLSI